MLKPIVLIVLDGWGISHEKRGNAILQAKTPFINELDQFYPKIALQASGIAVGLPWEEMGNSEVGHLNIGAGQVIYQNLPRISLAIRDGSFFQNQAFNQAVEHTKKHNSALHLMGLLSSAGVHSYIEHLEALLELASKQKIEKVFLHLFTDGRDSSPTEAVSFLTGLGEKIKSLKTGEIASISGRYFAMDRNNNWDRTKLVYDCLTQATGDKKQDPIEAVRESYQKEVTDEFIKPINILRDGKPVTINDNDAVIFFNFREDRARQLTKAFVGPDFKEFKRQKLPKNLCFVTMTEYEKGLPTLVAFPPQEIKNTLAEVISRAGLHQLRMAETEKYAHVTYFFNGGKENPVKNEKRILVPSPTVASYDQKPEMSAPELTHRLLEELKTGQYDFVVVNYANPDMVGHTGNLQAAIKAVETVDECLKQVVTQVLKMGGGLVITADHGDVEEMINLKTGQVLTEHSLNPVPLWLVAPEFKRKRTREEILRAESAVGGILADIAPTILELMGMEKPMEMSGQSLLSVLTTM